MKLRDKVYKTMNERLCHNEFGELFLGSIEEAADAIIAELPECVPDLVWDKGAVDWARLPQGGKYVACSNDRHGTWSWWLDGDPESRQLCENEQAAKAAASAHNRAAVMAAFGVTL